MRRIPAFLLILAIGSLFADSTVVIPDNRVFADYLYSQQLYLDAAREYLRLRFDAQNILPADSVFQRAAESYARAGGTGKAIQLLDSAALSAREPLRQSVLALYNAKLCLAVGNDSACISRVTRIVLPAFACETSVIALACSLLHPGSSKISAIPSVLPLNRRDTLLLAVAADWRSRAIALPSKKTVTAGLLSTLLPGAGQLYSDNFRDGFAALALITLCAYQTWDGFSHTGLSSWKGWGFGAACAVFYGGNIYGSVQSAGRFNRREQELFFKSIRFTIHEQF